MIGLLHLEADSAFALDAAQCFNFANGVLHEEF
jgi:hypothetical protein